MSFYVLFAPVVSTILAITIDVASYRSYTQRRGYSPNLSLLGAGFLLGLCVCFMYLLGSAVEKFLMTDLLNNPPIWPKLTLLLVPASLLALGVWAIARICSPD